MKQPVFSPHKTLGVVLILLFLLEAAVMAVINFLQLPPTIEAILDASALILLAIPVLFVMFIRPLIHQYQAAQRANKTIETMYATSVELSKNLELNWVIEVLIQQVKVLVPVDRAVLYLDQPPDKVILSVKRNLTSEENGGVTLVRSIESCAHPMVKDMMRNQRSGIISDVTEVEGWDCPEGAQHGRSWMGIPLVLSGEAVGMYEFTNLRPGVFTEEHLRLAEDVVSQATLAVQNALLFEQLRSAHEQLQVLIHKTVMFHETERRSLAKTLYDRIGQSMSSVILQSALLNNAGQQSQEDFSQQLNRLVTDLDEISKDLHDLADNLRPASLDFLGLQGSLNQYIDRLQEKYSVVIHFDGDSFPSRLPEVAEVALFRIAQEALSNAIRHGKASMMDVHLQQQGENGVLIVEDNGEGFSLESVDLDRCFGLLDMRERAEMLGGEFSIESEPGKGTTVRVSIPTSE